MEARNSGLGTHKRDFRIGGMAGPPSQPLRPQSLFVVLKNRLRRHPLSCRLKKLSPLLCARPGEDDRQVAIPPLTVNGLDLAWSRLRTQVASFSVVSVPTVEHSQQQSALRALQLAVDICAVGSILSLIACLCLIGLWLTTPYSTSAVGPLFSLPMALICLLLALSLIALCTFLDAKLHRSQSQDLGRDASGSL